MTALATFAAATGGTARHLIDSPVTGALLLALLLGLLLHGGLREAAGRPTAVATRLAAVPLALVLVAAIVVRFLTLGGG